MAEKIERCIEYKSDSIHYGGKALKLTRGELL